MFVFIWCVSINYFFPDFWAIPLFLRFYGRIYLKIRVSLNLLNLYYLMLLEGGKFEDTDKKNNTFKHQIYNNY